MLMCAVCCSPAIKATMLAIVVSLTFSYLTGAVEPPPPAVYADLGQNASLACPAVANDSVVWVREGRALEDAAPAANGLLVVHDVSVDDQGLYGCRPDGGQLRYVQLLVRRLPGALVNVTVRAHTVLAELFWHVNDTGSLLLTRIGLRYRAHNTSEWRQPIPPHVAPSEVHRELYHLRPNTTYQFELWAENRLGAGPTTTVSATTRPDPSHTDVARGLVAEALVFGSESWVAAVSVSLVVVLLVTVGGACFVWRSQRSVPANGDSSENMELVAHLQQPGYELEVLEQDENSNSQRAHLLNNNVEIHPVRI